MNFKKLSAAFFVAVSLCSSVVFASDINTVEQPREGYTVDYEAFDTAQLVGLPPRTKATVVLNSTVQRYKNSSTNQYYASGSVNLVNNANGSGVFHFTTVQLENFWGNAIVSTKNSGYGNVSATTGQTPMDGTAKVYYSY